MHDAGPRAGSISMVLYGCQSALTLPQEEDWADAMTSVTKWKPELREVERLVQSHIKW